MRILQINASYKPAYIYGGPTMSVSELSEHLLRANCDVQVFTTTANGNTELDVEANVLTCVEKVPVTYFKRILKGHIHLSTELLVAVWQKCKQFDIVHIHAWWNLVSVLSCLIAVVRGAKVVVSPRGTLSSYSFVHKNNWPKKVFHNLIGRPIFKRCYIHATSRHEDMMLKGVVNPIKTYVIPNFVALPSEIQPSLTTMESEIKLLFFSRIDRKKGLEILLQALSLVKRNYHLTIAGGGDINYINSLKEISKTLNIQQHVTWIGIIREDKFDLLASHHLMILPSHNENFGNVVIESLSVGTAVMLSPHVGLSDHVSANRLGWIVANDPNTIANAIDGITPLEISTIRQRSPAIIRSDFNDETLSERYQAMYKNIING